MILQPSFLAKRFVTLRVAGDTSNCNDPSMNDSALAIVLIVVAVFIVLWLIGFVFGLFAIGLVGAVYLFAYASEQGFIGIAERRIPSCYSLARIN